MRIPINDRKIKTLVIRPWTETGHIFSLDGVQTRRKATGECMLKNAQGIYKTEEPSTSGKLPI